MGLGAGPGSIPPFVARRKRAWASLSPLLAAALSLPCAAQEYPTKPVRMVVPFPPGAGTDILARAIGQKLTESWGQTVVVDNRPGAGGTIGSEFVAKAPRDGYTLLMGNVSTLAMGPPIYRNIGYDSIKDFAPVSLVSSSE